MVMDPVVIGVKVVILAVIGVVLWILHGFLAPEHFRIAVIVAVGAFALLTIALWIVVVRLLKNPRSAWARGMVLSHEAQADEGFTAMANRDYMIGERGVALSPLRPSGIAAFGDRRLQVVTEGEFIKKGSPVAIVAVAGSRVVVRQDAGESQQTQPV